jgi:CrcB protein
VIYIIRIVCGEDGVLSLLRYTGRIALLCLTEIPLTPGSRMLMSDVTAILSRSPVSQTSFHRSSSRRRKKRHSRNSTVAQAPLNAPSDEMTGLIPNDAIAIGVGAFLGATTRYQVGRWTADYIATDPRLARWQGWHTAAINVSGSFLLGGITGSPLVSKSPSSPPSPPNFTLFPHGLSPRAKLMFGVGFCGSFTTFSTYSVDIATWLAQGQTGKAVLYIAANNLGGVLAAATGLVLVKKLFGTI